MYFDILLVLIFANIETYKPIDADHLEINFLVKFI